MEIYEQIRQDRESGTRRLVAEYRERLQTAARLLCGDSHEAEDLVFRAFERAILKIDEFRPTGSFYYWIYTILLNFHRMDARKKLARKVQLANDELPDVEDDKPGLFEEFTFRASAEAVRAAVSKLPDNYREVVVLKYFEEMSTGEIAKVAGIPEGTVRSRLHYARNALHAMLADTELSPDFADRLVKATRPKAWLFRKAWALPFAFIAAFAAIAAGTTAVLIDSHNSEPAEKTTAGEVSSRRMWRMADSRSTFSPTADEVDKSIERALQFLAANQRPDGSFPRSQGETAAIPALVAMAYLSKGHLPSSEPYSGVILKCLDRVLATADMNENSRWRGYMGGAGNGRMYSHSIATLFLSEISGMVDDDRQKRIDEVLPFAVKVIVDSQNHRKRSAEHIGGWRYTPDAPDSDLSCSGWALMALRSARLNGAKIPDDSIEKAVLYIKRMQSQAGLFGYQGANAQHGESLSGAAILCLELCGRHLDPASLKAAKSLDTKYKKTLEHYHHRCYAFYYTAQGFFQLGGERWEKFEEWMHSHLVKKQLPDGSWPNDAVASPAYSTAMTVLALTVPYRMLPIYQRDETVNDEEERNDDK